MSSSVLLFNSKSSLYLKLQLRTPQPKLAAWNSIRQSCHGLQPCFWVMKSFTPFDGDVLANESVIWDWWEHFTQRDEPGGEQNRANLWLCASCRSPRWFPAVYNETSCRAHGEWSAPPWLQPGNDTSGCDNTCLVPTHAHANGPKQGPAARHPEAPRGRESYSVLKTSVSKHSPGWGSHGITPRLRSAKDTRLASKVKLWGVHKKKKTSLIVQMQQLVRVWQMA